MALLRALLSHVQRRVKPHSQHRAWREINFVPLSCGDCAATTNENPRQRAAGAAENRAEKRANACTRNHTACVGLALKCLHHRSADRVGTAIDRETIEH